MFFFSSRRRHTRLVSDWSSDVCSSDLLSVYSEVSGAHTSEYTDSSRSRRAISCVRSEERRVGKECRSRWLPHEEKKKRQDKRATEQGRRDIRGDAVERSRRAGSHELRA